MTRQSCFWAKRVIALPRFIEVAIMSVTPVCLVKGASSLRYRLLGWLLALMWVGAAWGCGDPPRVAVPEPAPLTDPKRPAPKPEPDEPDEPDPMPAEPGPEPEPEPEPEPVDPVRQPGRRSWQIGRTVQGRPLIAELYGSRGPVLLLLAAIHGNERSAVTFGEQVRTTLLSGLAQQEGVQIVFIGAANPDGIEARTRHNARDIDLNRNFDARSFGQGRHAGGTRPLSEPESVALTEVVERVAPSAVVSVHCCIPTMDYDGPGRDLATRMSRAANDRLRQLHDGATTGYRTFPAEKLGASPGSMGSYVGVDLDIPIITLEFASNHLTRTSYQLEAIHESIWAAATWTSTYGQATMTDLAHELEQLELATPQASYGSQAHRATSSAHWIMVEHWGQADEAPVLILSGVRDNPLHALHVAEHVRRLALHEASPRRLGAVSVLTAANPSGIASQTSQTITGDTIEAQLSLELPELAEAQALVELITSRPPRRVLLIEGDSRATLQGTRAALTQAGALRPDMPGELEIIERPLQGALPQWLEAQGIPVVRLGVDDAYAEGDDRRDPAFPFLQQRRFGDAALHLMR